MEIPNQASGPGGLSRREMLFCYHYARLGCPEEAALRAGYGADSAARLLIREDILAGIELRRVEFLRETEAVALAGLRRAAFGGAEGIARLARMESGEPWDGIERLDLFGLAELKAGKGACEVKQLDRLKALGMMLEYAKSTREGGADGSLLEALEKGARAVADGGDPV